MFNQIMFFISEPKYNFATKEEFCNYVITQEISEPVEVILKQLNFFLKTSNFELKELHLNMSKYVHIIFDYNEYFTEEEAVKFIDWIEKVKINNKYILCYGKNRKAKVIQLFD